MAGKLSIKRQLAARVAEATGLDPRKVELVLRGLYEETLRAAHEQVFDGRDCLHVPGVGGFRGAASRRGSRCPRTGRKLCAHWAFWFKPSKALVRRTAEICAARRGS